MPARRVKSIFHGRAKNEVRVFHHSHRSKKGRSAMNKDNTAEIYKKKKEKLKKTEKEEEIYENLAKNFTI